MLEGAEKRGTVAAEFEKPKASRRRGMGRPSRLRDVGERRKLPQRGPGLVHFKLEKMNLVMTNLMLLCHLLFLSFLPAR